MKISVLLDKKSVLVDFKAKDKDEAISELIDLLVSSGKIKKGDRDSILKNIREREQLGSTGIGKGVAIPHAKADNVKKMVAAFAVSKEGLDFRSLDGEPTHLFFLLVAPGETPGPHLKALAKISRLLDDKFIRDSLRSANKVEGILEIFKREEAK